METDVSCEKEVDSLKDTSVLIERIEIESDALSEVDLEDDMKNDAESLVNDVDADKEALRDREALPLEKVRTNDAVAGVTVHEGVADSDLDADIDNISSLLKPEIDWLLFARYAECDFETEAVCGAVGFVIVSAGVCDQPGMFDLVLVDRENVGEKLSDDD